LGEYLLAYRYNPVNPELNYKLGMSYLRSDKKALALEYLKSAYDEKPQMTDNLLLLLARAYQYNLNFDTAVSKYDAYFKSLSRRQKKKQADEINKYKEECNSGKELVSQPKRAVISNIGDFINSTYDDYNALVTSGDSMMYFTSRRPSRRREKPNKATYMYDEDVYTALNMSGEWQNATYLSDDDFNSKHNDDIVWISQDGKTRYLYDGYLNGGDILISVLKKRGWSSPERISRKFKSKSAETSVSVTGDGNTIYFVSNNNDDENFGGKDIFCSHKNKRGRWEEPKNIGSVLNSKFDEEAVWVSPDDKILYFSSKGHNSMGGYDVFRSEKDAGGNWGKPVNIGFPVNTPDDELFFRPSVNEKTAYYAAKRPDTRGGFDIYKVIYLGSEKKLLQKTEEQPLAYFDKPISDIFSRISGEEKIDTTYFMVGFFTDAKKKTPVFGKLDLIDVEKSMVVASTMSDSLGAYRIKLPELKKYGVEIHAKDYMFFLDVVAIPSKVQGRDVTRNFALAKVEVGTKIVLKNIYFETGKAILTPESNTELDKVVTFLKDNDELKVEISGHTDNVGLAAANVKLSELRAKAVVNYLIKQGIPEEKLVPKGYGPAQPISPNTTAAGKKLNRRVEFKILSKE
jgi:outer membrane protein OmpA-like peptidoglycan-associated protein